MAPNSKTAGEDQPDGGAAGARDQPLKSLGKYQIVRRLGSGGMGTVYLANDTELKRTVALKVLPKDKAKNKTLVKRFRSEAQAAAHLKHDNIVTIYEAGSADGLLYIALEYVEGTDVHALVYRRGPLSVKRSIDIVKQVARALEHAHEQNIVHRDIKPSNLLIQSDGTVKLADMGLARSIDDTTDTGITRAGTTVGTVDYMSPEQARDSKAADVRSDIYSLGCTWFQMLTGSPPYPEGGLTNKLRAHAAERIPDPRTKRPEIPETLVAVMHRMMAKAPKYRYQSPCELIADLENAVLTDEDVTSRIMEVLTDDEVAPDENAPRSGPRPVTGPEPSMSPPISRKPSSPRRVSAGLPSRQADVASPTSRRGSPRRRSLHSEPDAAGTADAIRYTIAAAMFALLAIVGWLILSWLDSLGQETETPDNANPFVGMTHEATPTDCAYTESGPRICPKTSLS